MLTILFEIFGVTKFGVSGVGVTPNRKTPTDGRPFDVTKLGFEVN
jgi:hypothetical protein